MSAEEFIYSVINSDNVAQLDLNVIANTLASADSLIQRIKAQQVENEGLKEKISSLRSSALQIKQLYEAEVGKNQGIVQRGEDYVRKVQELEGRVAAAENARVNAELQGKETVAELERKAEHWMGRYDGLAMDMVRNCCLLADNGLLPAEQLGKYRDWKCHVQGMVQDGKEVPEDVLSCLSKKRSSSSLARKKRKSEAECRDQGTMTAGPSYCSIGVNAVEEKPRSADSSTSTEGLEPAKTQYSITDDVFPVEPQPKKVFADKSTMYSSSTVTRSTCTSAFIKRVDVGVNFPEVVPKSISEILRECVIELPSLLSPILDEIPIRKESASTQTDSADKPPLVTTGTNTTLRNIRRKVDYVRKADGLLVNNLLSFIKKEESISPVGSLQNLPAAVFQSDPSDVNPQLTHIWGLLGETMFRLLGTGRMFDSQCYSIINERIAMINSLIESESRRGTAMMSEVFAAAATMASDKAGEVGGKKRAVVGEEPVVSRGKSMDEYEEDAVGMHEEEDSNGPWESQPPLPDEEVEPQEDDVVRDEETQTEVIPSGSQISVAVVEAAMNTEESSAMAAAADDVPEATSSASVSNQTKEQDESPSSPKPPRESPIPDEISPEAPSPQNDESVDFCSLMESGSGAVEICANSSATKDADEQLPQLQDEEPDEIANELRQMEEGVAKEPELDRLQPCLIRVRDIEQVETKHYLDVVCEEESSHTTDDESDLHMTIVETSPNRLSVSSSCTSIGSNGTLISPIKVKETNELVKDQFKTPTSPAISKRKLRERTEGGPSKRGRLSPTTESLLEDDWDHKFSRIKNYFTLPSGLNPIKDGSGGSRTTQEYFELDELWGDEDDDGDEGEEKKGEFGMPCEQLLQPLRLDTSSAVNVAVSDSPESPTEEPSATSISSWDGFKRPLNVDVTRPTVPPSTLSNTPASPDAASAFLDDSPMSPIADEEPRSPRCFSELESPMSPPPESRSTIYTEPVEPRNIPLENPLASRILTEASTPMGKAIACYKRERRAEVLNKITPNACKKEKKLIQELVSVIMAYVKDEWTAENVDIRSKELLNVSGDTRVIAQAIVDCIMSLTEDLVIDVQCSPPAPPLPKATQKVVLLAKTLNEVLFTLDRILLQEVDRRVFNLKSDKTDLAAITALTYLYVGIADCNRLYGCTARMYIYKCLYYFNYKGLPLIYYVLKAFPHALPKKASAFFDNSDAMVSTIRTVLMNINYMEKSTHPEAALYKKCELQKLLKYFYGYQHGSPTYAELITNLIEKIKANKLKNVDYCLILVAKRQGYEWAKRHIVQKHLYPLLNDYLKRIETVQGTHDDQIRCLIFCISAILKTQPNYEDVTGVMQIFGSIIQRTDGNQRLQEAAVAGLMRFTRFDYADIYEWLCKWRPSYEVSGRIKLMLATFVHRKDERFWKQLGQRKFV